MKREIKRPTPHLVTLVTRLSQGDVEAFCEIYKLYYNKLLRYGSIIHREPKVVEDVIQDLFIWVLENPQKIINVNNFEVYLFQSLKRNLREVIKKNGRRREIIHQFTKEDTNLLFHESIEQKKIHEETYAFNKNWVKQQLEHLPPRQKEIIYLRYYEGLSYNEIAEIIGSSNQVARNYAARALQKLRRFGNLEKMLTCFILLSFLLLFSH